MNGKLVKLKDVVSWERGLTYSKKDEVKSNGIPVLRATNINLESHKIILNEIRFISKSVKIKKEKYVEKGDILICTASGSKIHLGKVALIEQNLNMAFGGFMAVLKCTKDCNSKFLYYHLTSPKFKKHLSLLNDGANINNLKFSQIEDYEFFLPSIIEQKQTVVKLNKLYGEIDSQIRLLEKKSKNTSTFLNQLLNTVKGNRIKLDNLIDIKTGKLDSNAMVDGGKYPFFTCSKQIFNIDSFAFDCEAVLLAGNNASGDFNVKHYIGKFNAYQRTYVLTVKDSSKLKSRYLYFQLIQALSKFKTMSVGANTKFLKIDMIKNFEIPLPSLHQQETLLKKLKIIEQNLNYLDSNFLQQKHLYSNLKSSILLKEFKQKKQHERSRH